MLMKGFNKDLTGANDFQFEVGKIYRTDNPDCFFWFHYSDSFRSVLENYHNSDSRYCEVEALGRVHKFQDHATTDKIKIVREIPREEMFQIFSQTKMPKHLRRFYLERLKPSFEVLLEHKEDIYSNVCFDILQRKDLTNEQKKELLPKCYHKKLV